MISALNSIPFARLLWLVPVFLTLHNLEEAPLMEAWSRRLPLKILPPVSTRQFVAAVTFLTLVAFLATYLGVVVLGSLTGYLLVLEIQTILLVNAFIPHIATTIRFQMYSPGVVTAVLINIPFSMYLFHRALSENILTWSQIWFLMAVAPFAMVIFAFLSLQVGKLFER